MKKWLANCVVNDKQLSQASNNYNGCLSDKQSLVASFVYGVCAVLELGSLGASLPLILSRQSRHQRDSPLCNQCSNPQSQSRSPLSPLCGHLGNFQHSNMDLLGKRSVSRRFY